MNLYGNKFHPLKKYHCFSPTPLLPSYLFSLVAGKLESVKNSEYPDIVLYLTEEKK